MYIILLVPVLRVQQWKSVRIIFSSLFVIENISNNYLLRYTAAKVMIFLIHPRLSDYNQSMWVLFPHFRGGAHLNVLKLGGLRVAREN